MESSPPFIEDIRVDGMWSGDVTEPVSIDLLVDVAVKSSSHLRLIQKNHPSVLSAQITNITKLNKAIPIPTRNPRIRHSPQQKALDSPVPFSGNPPPVNRQYVPPLVHNVNLGEVLIDLKTKENSDITKEKENLPSISADQQQSAAEPMEIALFAQTASLYDATNSRDSAFSPTPLTSKKLTIPKRRSLELDSLRISNQHPRTKQAISRKECSSPRSLHKRPVSLDKRPPWRPVGAEDTTKRGRRQLGTRVAQRRISRSAGTLQVERGQARQRQSSLPGRAFKTETGRQNLQPAVPQFNSQTLPRGRLAKMPISTGSRGRDTTVKVTHYAEALSASERLEKWLDDRRNQSHPEISSPDEIVSDHDGSFLLPGSNDSSPALSLSPTPSSRAALPWTSVRGIRGGGFTDDAFAAQAGERFIPTLVDDNGTLYAYFQGANIAESTTTTFQIKIHASIKLEAHTSGYHSLTIPGMPLQNGNAKGTFTLRVVGPSSSKNDNFKAHEKIAYLDDFFATHPLQDDQMCHKFPLEKTFSINLLCFEACRDLGPSDFEIDSDVHTRYEWGDLEGDSITAEHSMICSLRLRPFLMWAENVRFKLHLIGGPSGSLEASLNPGNRRLYLEGNCCDAEHELEISLICSVADLQKTFTISWQRSLGVCPFEVWLPRISGLHHRKLENIFDLPDENCVSIAPRPCKKSRTHSMAAQEKFLKSPCRFFFFPENQHTPSTIQQSLRKQSSQFCHELTAEDPDYGSKTISTVDFTAPLKYTFITLKSNKRTRTGQSTPLKNILRDFGNRPVETAAPGEDVTAAPDDTKPTESVSAEAGPERRKFFLTQRALLMLEALRCVFHHLAAPVQLLKFIVLIWLCFRAFDHAQVIQVEKSVLSNARAAWNSGHFEPVHLYDDFTEWTHLLARVSEGTEIFIRDGHFDGLPSRDLKPEEKQEEAETMVEMSDEGPREEISNAQELMEMTGESDGDFSSPATTEDTGDDELTLLDRIDLALGWKPPAGGW